MRHIRTPHQMSLHWVTAVQSTASPGAPSHVLLLLTCGICLLSPDRTGAWRPSYLQGKAGGFLGLLFTVLLSAKKQRCHCFIRRVCRLKIRLFLDGICIPACLKNKNNVHFYNYRRGMIISSKFRSEHTVPNDFYQ